MNLLNTPLTSNGDRSEISSHKRTPNYNFLAPHFRWILILSSLFTVVSLPGKINAATITVTSSTNWSALTGGSGPGGAPSSNDTVIVRTRAVLTVNVANANCEAIILGQPGNNNNGELVFNAASQLTVDGIVSIGNTGNRTSAIIMTNGGLLACHGFNVVNASRASFTAGTGTIQLLMSHNLPATVFTNFYRLTIDGPSITVRLGAATTISNSLNITAGIFDDNGFQLTSSGTLNLTSGNLFLGSASTATQLPAFTTLNYGAGATITFSSGAPQIIRATNYPSLVFSGTGTKTTAAGTISVSGDWLMNGGDAILSINNTNVNVTGNISGSGNMSCGSGTISLQGNWTQNGSFNAGSGEVVFNGSAQTVAGQSYFDLVIDQSSGTAILAADASVSNSFNLLNGNFDLQSNRFTVGESATMNISSPSSNRMIVANGTGVLRKNISTAGSILFPIGEQSGLSEYSPITINLISASGFNNAYIEVSVTNTKHPNNASFLNFLNRFWDVTASGITNAVADINANYTTADISGTENNISAARLNGAFDQINNPWEKFNALNSNTLSANSVSLTDSQTSSFTGLTSAGPTVNISGGDTTVCVNVPVSLQANSIGDGSFIYSWSPSIGLSFSDIANPTATVTSTTTYILTVIDGNGFTASENTTITIVPEVLASRPGGITGNTITCNGSTGIQYSVQPATNAVTYSWTVPSGATQITGGNSRIITVDFPNPYTTGTICVVSNSNCGTPSSARCTTITNVSQYSPNRITGPSNVCANSTGILYEALYINGATNYNWTLPSGMVITSGAGTRNISVDAGPAVSPGQLCVSVDNGCGTSQTYCININVSSANQPGGITGPASVCANLTSVSYSVQPVSGATSYTWTLPSGFNITSGSGTRIITVDISSNPTAGDVCVTANFSCGSSLPRCKTISITGLTPGPITGASNICAGTSGLTYSVAAVSNATSYNWTLPAGITQTSGGNSQSITVDVGPSYTQGDICVTITTPCGTSLPACLSVKDFSLMTPGGITGPGILCQNTNNVIFSISPVDNAVSYEWFVPPGITITSGHNTRIITTTIGPDFSIGDIGVRATSACFSNSLIRWNSKTTAIVPAMPEFINSSQSVCSGSTVTLSTSIVKGAASYEWTLPAGISFSAAPPNNSNSVSVDISAGFVQGIVCVKAISACGIPGYSFCQTFNTSPGIPAAINGPAGVCAGQSGLNYSITPLNGATNYEWSLPPGWSMTSGIGTTDITVSVPTGFVQGQIKVKGINSCGNAGGNRVLNVSNTPSTPGTIAGATALCAGNSYIFSVSAMQGVANYQWLLPAGISFTSGPSTNGNSISVDVTSGFTGGSICVTAQSACGGNSSQRCLTLTTMPDTPGAIAGPATVCEATGGIVYSITPIPGINNYQWVLPSGFTLVAGQGTTTLTIDVDAGFTSGSLCVAALDECGNPGINSCITVSLNPAAPSDIIPQTNFCPGTVRTLSTPAITGIDSYNWTLPSGITLLYGQGTSAVTVLIDPGFSAGNVCVNAISDCGATGAAYCENINTFTPTAPTAITSNGIACIGSEILLSVPLISGAGSYNWNMPVGLTITSGQGSPTVTASVSAGFTTGNVCVVANSGCNTSSASYCQNITTTPLSLGTLTAPNTVCANESNLSFYVAQSAGATSYSWTLPAGMSVSSGSGSNSITVSTNAAFTSGTVSVQAVSACAVTGPARSVSVGSTPTTPTTINLPLSACPGSQGVTFSTPVLNGAVSYLWTVPAEFTITSGINTNSITVDIGAGFTAGQICVSAVSACGTAGAARCSTINTVPSQPGSVSGITTGVCGLTYQYSVTAVPGATSYTWTAPAGAVIVSGQGTRIVQVSFTNNFSTGRLQLFASNSCGNSTVRQSGLIIGAPAKPASITGPVSVCANQSGYVFTATPSPNSTTYNWGIPAGSTITNGQGTNEITVNWGNNGGTVQVNASNLCGSSINTTLSVAVSCRITSGKEISWNAGVYPVPAIDELILEINSDKETKVEAELIDLSGKKVLGKNTEISKGANRIVWDVKQLPGGIYILQLTTNEGISDRLKVVLN